VFNRLIGYCVIAFAAAAYLLAIGLALWALTTDPRIKTITVKLEEPPAEFVPIGGCTWDYDKYCWYLL